jgi:hypothetical protein
VTRHIEQYPDLWLKYMISLHLLAAALVSTLSVPIPESYSTQAQLRRADTSRTDATTAW